MESIPIEMQQMIFEQLTFQDLLNLWIASPILPTLFPQRFWRSRFRVDMELGCYMKQTRCGLCRELTDIVCFGA